MQYYPPKTKVICGMTYRVVQDCLEITGNQKHFTEAELVEVKRIIDSYEAISWEHLVREAALSGIGRIKAHAVVDYLLDLGELFEPIMGYVSMTAKARVGGAL